MPAGSYEVEVVKAVVKAVKSEESDHYGEDYIRLELRPIEHPDERFFSNLNFWPSSKRFLMRDLLALGYDEAEIKADGFEVEPEGLEGRKAIAVVGIRKYDGEDQNDVKKLLPIGESEGNLPT